MIYASGVSWNTHTQIREHFGYPLEDEFVVGWLDWYYGSLTKDQRIELRTTPLSEIDISDYLEPPYPRPL